MTIPSPAAQPDVRQLPAAGESRWPMALAVLAAGGLRAVLPPALRNGDARWAFVLVVFALLAILVIGDPGRIDRDSTWLRAATGTLIGLISAVNASAAVRLVAGIISDAKFSNDANILLASGGAMAHQRDRIRPLVLGSRPRRSGSRARVSGRQPAFVFPEMTNAQYVGLTGTRSSSTTCISRSRPPRRSARRTSRRSGPGRSS
jgi:hypothetical protein